MLIHHAGKGGQQRGTSRREDVLDTVITMKRPTGYKQEDGACLEIFFEKNRALFGNEVKPFGAYLESKKNDDGIETFEWICKSLEDSTFDTVCALSNNGLENWEISKELEIHKSTVSRYVQLGKDKGTIKPLNS